MNPGHPSDYDETWYGGSMRVHLLHSPPPEAEELFEERLPKAVELTVGQDPPEPERIEILVAGVPSRELLESCTQLQTLIIPYAGLPGSTRKLMADFPKVAVHNLHHNAIATAEMAMALFLAAAKNVVPIDRKLRAGDWTPRYEGSGALLVSSRTAVIYGHGSIGRAIARACEGLGMNVVGVRRGDRLDDVLPQADALFVAVPLTPDTEGSIGREELAALPEDAVIVNVARGPVIDEKAFFHALESGRIRAGIDVWYQYPRGENPIDATPPSTFPFGDLPNVVLSPHRGGHCGGIERIRAEGLIELLEVAASGGVLPNAVDLERGY